MTGGDAMERDDSLLTPSRGTYERRGAPWGVSSAMAFCIETACSSQSRARACWSGQTVPMPTATIPPYCTVLMAAKDYLWFEGTPLSHAYCLTMVEGIDPAEALRRIDARPTEHASGLSAFLDFADKSFPRPHPHSDGLYGIGATQLDGWTLLLEWIGILGISMPVLLPLSDGARVVSHYSNVDAEDWFYLIEDGDLRLRFEPLFPYRREGSDPDGLVDVTTQVGFDLRRGEDRDYSLHTEATFALAEHITGIRITQELLDTSTYLCGRAPSA